MYEKCLTFCASFFFNFLYFRLNYYYFFEMAPVKKKKKLSSTDQRPISAPDTNHQKPLGSFVTFGKRRSLRVATKMKNRRWLCNDIWVDILPLFRRPQLGLKLALLSPRFNALVNKHFDSKSELTIWRPIRIDKMKTVPKLCVVRKGIGFFKPIPDHPMHNKIRFSNLQIKYIEHSVITFLCANQQIFDNAIKLNLHVPQFSYNPKNVHPIWSVFARKIWPIFAPNIRHLNFANGRQLENLLRYTSPTILCDHLNIKSISADYLLPAVIGDDATKGPNAKAGQALTKWLHTPRSDGQPKQLSCRDDMSRVIKLVNNFKKAFLRATISSAACYIIRIELGLTDSLVSLAPFELMNERSNEMLTLEKENSDENVDEEYDDEWEKRWIMKRCQIGQTAVIQWENGKTNNLSKIDFTLTGFGPLSPPVAGQISAKGPPKMNPGPSGERKKK